MGFKDVRARVIQALQSGQYGHENRENQRKRNLLYAHDVTPEFVVDLLLRCSGDQYESSRHHLHPALTCHVFTPERRGERWYVKVYFLLDEAVFISVHR
ncbi:MAG TPA: hypothetical protein VFY65_03265 [Longimicrobium sp.]|nr:hypothetical protein [Longimicrobium sp.]